MKKKPNTVARAQALESAFIKTLREQQKQHGAFSLDEVCIGLGLTYSGVLNAALLIQPESEREAIANQTCASMQGIIGEFSKIAVTENGWAYPNEKGRGK